MPCQESQISVRIRRQRDSTRSRILGFADDCSDFQRDTEEGSPQVFPEVKGIRSLDIESQVGDESPEDEDALTTGCLT